MKIIQVNLGLLPIPPNGWGAVEKIIWDYYQLLNSKGLECQIKYLNEIQYADDIIVHVHVANLANECHKRGIPYIFSLHDHHAYLYGKDSFVYKENLQAIENSVISTCPAKYLVDYFGSKKLRYFSAPLRKYNRISIHPSAATKYAMTYPRPVGHHQRIRASKSTRRLE